MYRFNRARIATAIHTLAHIQNVVSNLPAIDAGLTLLLDGGRANGGETFVSFARKAVALLQQQGHSARFAK